MKVVRVYSPPLPPGHPDYIRSFGLQSCGASTPRSGQVVRYWHCTVERGHASDHGAHAPGPLPLLLARWPQDPQPEPDTPDFSDEVDRIRDEADQMVALASIDATKALAITALDQAEVTGGPQWFVAAEHFVRALHALALFGSGVEDDDGEVG